MQRTYVILYVIVTIYDNLDSPYELDDLLRLVLSLFKKQLLELDLEHVRLIRMAVYDRLRKTNSYTVEPLYYKPLNCRNLYNKDTILCPSVVL